MVNKFFVPFDPLIKYLSETLVSNFKNLYEGTKGSLGVDNFISGPFEKIKRAKGKENWWTGPKKVAQIIVDFDSHLTGWQTFIKEYFDEVFLAFDIFVQNHLESIEKLLEIRRLEYESISEKNFPEIKIEYKIKTKEQLISSKIDPCEIPGINGTKIIVQSTFKLDQSAKALEEYVFLKSKETPNLFRNRINIILEEPDEPRPDLVIENPYACAW